MAGLVVKNYCPSKLPYMTAFPPTQKAEASGPLDKSHKFKTSLGDINRLHLKISPTVIPAVPTPIPPSIQNRHQPS